MSKHRYVGGIISSTLPTPSQASASGVWTLDEAQYYQKQGNWPSGSGADPYFQNTTLLLHGDGTNGAQNNTFLDSSTNNFTITRTGNTTQGSFNPYVGPGNWSVFYPTTQAGWQTPANSISAILGSAFNSTATFTVEAWIYPLSRHSGGGAVLGYVFGSMQLAGASADWTFGPDSNGNLVTFWYQGGNQICKGTSVIPLNTWTHIALSVSAGAIKMFVNGVQETTTGPTSITLSTQAVNYVSSGGYLYAGTTWQGFNGYISNLRVIGKRAVYTAGFTPSTTPLIATTDTTLLVNNQNGFNDISGANWLLTRTNAPQVSKFSPFTLYQTNPASYSGYFDGTGDYLTSTTNPAFNMGSADFTIEGWIYVPSAQSSKYLFGVGTVDGTTRSAAVWIGGTQKIEGYISADGSTWTAYKIGTTTVPVGQWVHVAFVRSGPLLNLYLNGVSEGTQTGTPSLAASGQPLYVGGQSSIYQFNGSISNVRITKGTAVYTANFTPSVAPLTSTTTVSSSASNSVSFDGSGDYLSVASNAAFGIGTGDFTIEYWINPNAFAANQTIFDTRSSGADIMLSDYITTSGVPTLYYNSANLLTATASISASTWSHIAWVRSGTTITCYINGVARGTATSSANFGTTQPMRIGANIVAGAVLNGFVSNFRFTKGQALYTTSFTPATTPLTTTSQGATAANVSLLTCQDRLLEDNSNNLFAVTPTGDARPTSMNPFVSTNGIGGTSYSGYFDGTGDYLTLPAPAATTIGTSSFTWEAWLFPTAVGTFSVIYDTNAGGDTTGTGRFLILLETSGQVKLSTLAGTSVLLASTVNLTSNRWVHVAITRSGTSGYMFFNGVQVATGTFSTNFLVATAGGTNRPIIGANGYNGSNGFSGNISNLRLIIGTALYTAGFSPSTTPLTAVTNTQLLTCQSTTFIDNSANAITITAAGNAVTDEFNPFSGATTLLTCQSTTFIDNSAIPVTITANGNATPKRANPFTDTVTGPTPYATTTYGGSAYFDGTGDYLTLGSQTNFAFGTGDFTIEAWIYPFAVAAGAQTIYDTMTQGDATGTGRIGFDFSTVLRFFTGAGTILISGGTMVARAWQHVALCKASGSTRLFLNGTQVGSTYADSNNYVIGTANRPIIGVNAYDASSNIFTGYISNLRVIKGTGLYTAPFVPPAAPVTAVTNTQLLVNGTNAGIFDNTTINDIETVGSAQVSTSVVKYGTGSMSFSSGNSYLVTPTIPATTFLAPNTWTIEGWFYFNSLTGTSGLMGFPDLLEMTATSTTLAVTYRNTPASAKWSTITATTSMALSTWHHIAIVLNGGTMTMYLNGTSVGTATTVGTPAWGGTGVQKFILGADDQYPFSGTPDVYLNGYIDDFRITNGYARYTANFTPPIQAFPNY